MPSSEAICVSGRPLDVSRETASRLNSSVNARRVFVIGTSRSLRSLSEVSTFLGEGQFRLPVPHRLMAEHDAADQEHLGEIAQAELVAQAPEHHERDDVARILRPVQQAGTALVKLPAALAAAEPAISLSRALRPAAEPQPKHRIPVRPRQKGRDPIGSRRDPPESVNSASVIPGGDWRMLTLAMPSGVITSKSGCNARVAGEPVQAARPESRSRTRGGISAT